MSKENHHSSVRSLSSFLKYKFSFESRSRLKFPSQASCGYDVKQS